MTAILHSWDVFFFNNFQDQQVFSVQFHGNRRNSCQKKKDFKYRIYGHAAICIMTTTSNPSAEWVFSFFSLTPSPEKSISTPSHCSPLSQALTDCVCSRQIGWCGGNMEEAAWTLVKAPPAGKADATQRGGTNSEDSLKSRRPPVALAHADFQKHFITCFLPAILCLRGWMKCLIKTRVRLVVGGN